MRVETMNHLVLMSLVTVLLSLGKATGNVVLITSNLSLSFKSTDANFAPRVRGSGICGSLILGSPLDACSLLRIKAISIDGSCSPFVLTSRGNCSFETKVRHAQKAGFSAVIVFNNEDSFDLFTMSGTPDGIRIHAVLITKAAGEVLAQYADDLNTECWILPTYENTAWSVMVISFISLLAIVVVLATCFIVRRHRGRHSGGRLLRHPEAYGMSSHIVKALPSVIFKGTGSSNGTDDLCAICLEDYAAGEKLRILPCCHKFHSTCVDSWLTVWRPFCPICKRDARLEFSELPASESTPLLSSSVNRVPVPAPAGATTQMSSPESPPIQIPPNPIDSHSDSLLVPSHSCDTLFSSSHQLPPRPGSPYIASAVVTPNASQHSSLQSLGSQGANLFSSLDLDSIEAFRASPYFTPPSFSCNPSPHIPGSYMSPSIWDSFSETSQALGSQQAPSLVCVSQDVSSLHPGTAYNSSQMLSEA